MELELLKQQAVPYEVGTGGVPIVNGKALQGGQIKLTDAAIETIVKYVEGGNYFEVALAAAGVSKHQLSDWRAKARHVRQMYPELDMDDWPEGYMPPGITVSEWQSFKLIDRMDVAEARAEAYAVLSVRKHFPDQWTAAMTFLERRAPERWRKRQTIESVEGGRVVDGLDEDALLSDPEAMRLLHDALEKVARRAREGEVIEGEAVEVDDAPRLEA